MDLQELRNRLDAIDRELCEKFAERMSVVEEIAAVKKEQGLALFDPEREQEILKKHTEGLSDELSGHAQDFFQTLLDISKRYQAEKILKDVVKN